MPDYAALARELNRRVLANPKERLRIIQEFYGELIAAGDPEGADFVLTLRSIVGENSGMPTWLQRSGVYIGVGTGVFLMIMIVLGTLGYVVPTGTKFLVVAVLALGSAFSAASWIGSIAVSGELPFLENQKPLLISATGGFATLVVVFALGYWFYIR